MIVQRALKQAGFGMRQLAEAEGLSYQLVRAWAVGTRTPRPENMKRLAEGMRGQAEKLKEIAAELDAAAETEGDGE